MITKDTPPQTPNALRLVCSEVWGGNKPIHCPIELPGIRGVLYSRPCDGGRGGDVHYLSVCGSGLLSRVCLADVAGHGETVATISAEMHHLLRRCMNQVDQRKVLAELNRRLEALGLSAMTTAAALTYYPPTRSLAVSYAGHPPSWYFRRSKDSWHRLPLEDDTKKGGPLVNTPLAIDRSVQYTRRGVKAEMGDRLLLVTDGVLEAPGGDRGQFGDAGVERVLQACRSSSCDEIARGLLSALIAHCGREDLVHDDVTFVVLEFIPGPTQPAWWLAIRNRIARPRGNGNDPPFVQSPS